MSEKLFELSPASEEITEADVERNPEIYPRYVQQQIRRIADGQSVWARFDFESSEGKVLHYFYKGSHCGYLTHLYKDGTDIWATGFGPHGGEAQLNRPGRPIDDMEKAKEILEFNSSRRWDLANQNRTFRDIPVVPDEEEAPLD